MAAISTLPNGRALDSQRSSEKEHNSWEFIRPASQDVGSYSSNVDLLVFRMRLWSPHKPFPANSHPLRLC